LQEEPKEKEKEKEKNKKKKKKSKKLSSSPLLDAQSPDPGLRLKVTKFMSSRLSVVKKLNLALIMILLRIQAQLEAKKRKKKSKKSGKESADESSDSSEASSQGQSLKKMTFGRHVTSTMADVINAPKDKVTTVPAATTVRRIPFLPHIPAVVGESRYTRAVRASGLVKASDVKQEFGKGGDAKLTFSTCSDPKKFIPGLMGFFANNHVRLGATVTDPVSLGVLNEVSNELSRNVNALSGYMDLNNLPKQSRDFLNEVLHDMKVTVEHEGAILEREIVDHAFHFMLKTGRIPPVLADVRGVGDLRQARRGNQVSGSDRFVFDPAKYPSQKKPGKEYQVCYDCANAMFRSGKLKEGENPPASVWFPSYQALMKHKAEKKCVAN
jgi:hypothetical protein